MRMMGQVANEESRRVLYRPYVDDRAVGKLAGGFVLASHHDLYAGAEFIGWIVNSNPPPVSIAEVLEHEK